MKNNQIQLRGVKEHLAFGLVLGGLGLASMFMLSQIFAPSTEPKIRRPAEISASLPQHSQYNEPTKSQTDRERPPEVLTAVEATLAQTMSSAAVMTTVKAPSKTMTPNSSKEIGSVSKVKPHIESNAAKTVSKSLVVALETSEHEADFLARAEAQLDQGELKNALGSLRRHLYVQEPTSEVLYQVATIGRQVSEYAIAEQALKDAGALDPKNSEIKVELARLYLETKDYRAARMAARHAIRLDKDNPMAWNLAGRVALMQYHWQRAEMAFRRAIAITPTHPMFYNNLGLLYVRMGEGEEAVDALEVAVELFDDNTPYFVFNNLGLAYEKINALEDARDAFEQAISANPNYTRARLNLERAVISIVELAAKKAKAQDRKKMAIVSPAPEVETEAVVGASN